MSDFASVQISELGVGQACHSAECQQSLVLVLERIGRRTATERSRSAETRDASSAEEERVFEAEMPTGFERALTLNRMFV